MSKGDQRARSKFHIPSTPDPGTPDRCVRIYIPDSDEHMRVLLSALIPLTKWTAYPVTGDTQARDTATAFSRALFESDGEVIEKCMSAIHSLRVTDCCIEYTTTEDPETWIELLCLVDCLTDPGMIQILADILLGGGGSGYGPIGGYLIDPSETDLTDKDCVWAGCLAVSQAMYSYVVDILEVLLVIGDAASNFTDLETKMLGIPIGILAQVITAAGEYGAATAIADLTEGDILDWACHMFQTITCGTPTPQPPYQLTEGVLIDLFDWLTWDNILDIGNVAAGSILNPTQGLWDVYPFSLNKAARLYILASTGDFGPDCSDDHIIACGSCPTGDCPAWGNTLITDWQEDGTPYTVSIQYGSVNTSSYYSSPSSIQGARGYEGSSYYSKAIVDIVLPDSYDIDSVSYRINRTGMPNWTTVTAVYVQFFDETDTMVYNIYFTQYWSDAWKLWEFTDLNLECIKKIRFAAANTSPSSSIPWTLWIDNVAFS